MITFKKPNGSEVSYSEDLILKVAKSLYCGCPEHIIKLLASAKDLQESQYKCISTNPQGFLIHSWLLTESLKLEETIYTLLADLLVKENILDGDYELNPIYKNF